MATIRDDHNGDFVMSESHGRSAADTAEEPYYNLRSDTRRHKAISPIVAAAIAVVALVILLAIFLPRSRESKPDNPLAGLESRLANLEARLAQLEGMDQQLAAQEKDLTQLTGGLEQVRADLSRKLNQIRSELTSLQQTQSQTPPKLAELRKPETSAPAKPEPKVYEVRAGDTLFGISRRYDLTVEQLRSYNKLRTDAIIQPGQKLLLSPP